MMKKQTIVQISVLLSLIFVIGSEPISCQERVTLRDGTIISGKLLRVSGDTLYFKTSFIEELPVGKDKIVRIEFEPRAEEGTTIASGVEEPPGMGKLILVVTGSDLTTSIRFRRSDDRATAVEANKILFQITANEKMIYEKIDDVNDNEIRSEGWTILKNKFQFGRYEVPLPSGEYRVSVYVGNDLANDYRRKFDSGSVGLSETKENVRVFNDGVTTLVLKSSQPFLSLGSYSLKWVE
jgi:hypothetical protein